MHCGTHFEAVSMGRNSNLYFCNIYLIKLSEDESLIFIPSKCDPYIWVVVFVLGTNFKKPQVFIFRLIQIIWRGLIVGFLWASCLVEVENTRMIELLQPVFEWWGGRLWGFLFPLSPLGF